MVVAGLEPSNIVKLTIIVILFAKEASEMGGIVVKQITSKVGKLST